MKANKNNRVMIRQAREEDLPALLDLLKHLHTEDEMASQVQLQATWESIMNREGIVYYLGEIEGKLVATCHLVVVPNLTRGSRPYGWIENVVTHADYRRQGIGIGILRHALAEAWKMECYKVMLMTGSKQAEVHEFYQKAGFQGQVKTAFLARAAR